MEEGTYWQQSGSEGVTNIFLRGQEPHLALIHIPIELYSLCLQPILRLLFGEDHDEDAARISWTNRHDFLNISITPVECSIICSRHLADRFVQPLADVLNKLYARTNGGAKPEIQISAEDYIVIQVDGQGLDAGQRVLELTSPLAMAGISIFFITTYFSDYILVPFRSQRTVTKALQQRGFVFSKTVDAFVSQLSPSSPILPQGGRPTSSPFYDSPIPTTPPAKDIPELQLRTFTRLKRNNVSPSVDSTILLANCAGSREYDQANEDRLRNDLLQVLLATGAPKPTLETLDFSAKFLSLTITSGEPISVLLEHRLLDRLGGSLLGAKEEDDALVPIMLDLRELPLEATGIVCGVAGRLAQGVDKQLDMSPKSTSGDPIEISFLSTARAGTVIVRASQLEKALEALDHGMKRVEA
ncbi:hypothetical protein H2200_000803 [Cladophialophora chaetospira]|uniref:CASTOR ACT domain-containing protein n=1 Tax=Cladophialophora chaetospira TaxID=386627 RepID=A0AA39CQP5_9EURO|nr:hypothetical protein H2200_000803 [Cladophialophora chaetospira]